MNARSHGFPFRPERSATGRSSPLGEVCREKNAFLKHRANVPFSARIDQEPRTELAGEHLLGATASPLPHAAVAAAAIVDHWLTTDRLPLPEWVRTPQRTLTEPWHVEPLVSLRPAARKATPKAIARHGIYLAASELESV